MPSSRKANCPVALSGMPPRRARKLCRSTTVTLSSGNAATAESSRGTESRPKERVRAFRHASASRVSLRERALSRALSREKSRVSLRIRPKTLSASMSRLPLLSKGSSVETFPLRDSSPSSSRACRVSRVSQKTMSGLSFRRICLSLIDGRDELLLSVSSLSEESGSMSRLVLPSS